MKICVIRFNFRLVIPHVKFHSRHSAQGSMSAFERFASTLGVAVSGPG